MAERRKTYIDPAGCSVCDWIAGKSTGPKARYSRTRACVGCVLSGMIDEKTLPTRPRRQTITVTEVADLNPQARISRADARLWGLPIYRTGTPCPWGHTGWRYTLTSNCLECRRK